MKETVVKKPMGSLVTLKTPLYKKGNHISRHLEALGPLELHKTQIITGLKIDYLELTQKNNGLENQGTPI